MPILGSLGAATAKGVGFTAVPAELPGTPTIGTAVQTGGTAVSVSYTAPTFDGNTSILSYTAIAYNYPSGTATGITGIAFGPNSGSVVVTGLTPGAAYTFKVYATNGIGNSGLSGFSNNLTTWTVSGAPTIGAVTYTNGNAFANVAYTAPVSNGGTAITSYTALAYVGGVFSLIAGPVYQSGSGSITVTGLIGGTSYTFKVYASNLVGNSALSNATSPATAVLTKPDAPAIGTATYTGGTSATVAYTAPTNNGGATITSYTVKAYIAGVATAITGSGTTSPLSITGLTKGTAYTFRVTATNTYGTSDASNDSNQITPLTVAAAPTIGTPLATSGTSVDVYFTAPTDTGGISTYITSYTATSTPGNITVTKTTGLPTPGSSSFISISGLTKGQSYTFTVYATNPIGNSANSTASTTVTPADIPNAPSIGLVTTSTSNTGTTGTVIVNYTAPADNGGATITSYTAVSTPGGITSTVSQAGSGTITVTGLVKGTAYTFVVYATNRVGNSVNSNISSSITPLTVPGAPTIGTSTATGPTSATVTYTAPTDTGGSILTAFTATSNPSATLTQSVTSTGVITITGGLTKGVLYTFTVTATNAIGTGAASSASNQITTWTEPGAPTIGTATEVNATTVSVTFTAGTTGGTPILDYTATAYISGVATLITATNTTSPITVTGLTQGTTYTFKVTARNSVGTGTASGASNTAQPADTPSKPTAPTVSTSTTYTTDGQVTVTFTAPYDGGTTITDYYIVSNPVTTTRTITQAAGGTYLFTSLTKGVAYTFAYAARNRIGISTYSNYSSSITPLTIPNAPLIGTAARFDATSVNVTYTGSTDDGGTAITSYTATSTPGSITASSLGSPILVTGLTKGTPYTFTVKANNSRGSSAESTISNSATPATIPNAPTIGTATTVSKSSASVAFTAPADNGGNTIISYTAVSSPSGISQTLTQSGSGTITVVGLNPATAYTFVVYATNAYGNSVNSSSSNQITTTNSYAVSASPTTINETSSKTVTFTISTIGVANGTTMYWTNSGTTGTADFDDAVNSGSYTISASGSPPVGTASVTRTTVADIFTEGTETIIFNVQYPSGTTVATTTVNVNDTSLTPTPTYTITESTSSINETTNRTVTYSISTTYVPNGTTLYWQLYSGVQAADFTAGSSTGSITISGASGTPATGGTASFSLTAATDKLTDGAEAFFIYLGTNSPASSYFVAGSGVTSLLDTSLTPGVVTISPTTTSRNIPKTGLAVTVSGTYVVTMSSGTVGTITSQEITSLLSVFSSKSVSPVTRTFTSVGQTQTISWSLTTAAVDYANTTYNVTFGSILDTADPDIANNYPTHAITLNRIAYSETVSVSPTSGYTTSNYTYTVTGAPGTTFTYYSNINGTPVGPVTLSGSAGDASAGSASFGPAQYWVSPGTYTVYATFAATNNTKSASVTVTYAPITFTVSPSGAMTGQVGSPFTGDQYAYSGTSSITASGGAGGPFSYAITSGSQPSGVSFSSTGVFGGTPLVSSFFIFDVTATGAASQTGVRSITMAIVAAPTMGSVLLSGNGSTYTVGSGPTVSWSSSSASGVGILVNTAGQGSFASSGSRSLTTNVNTGANFPAGSYTVFLTPIAINGVSTGTVVQTSYTLYNAPTITFGATTTAPPYNSSTASSVSVKGGTTAYYNWTSTNADTVVYYISTNGSAYSGPNSVGTQGPSGPLMLGDVTITATTYFTLYLVATNAAGTTATSPGATIFWTPYTEVMTISPTTFSGTSGTTVTLSGGYPNDAFTFSINSPTYDTPGPGLNSSGYWNNPLAFQGSLAGTYTLYVKFTTTGHTRQQTITVT